LTTPQLRGAVTGGFPSPPSGFACGFSTAPHLLVALSRKFKKSHYRRPMWSRPAKTRSPPGEGMWYSPGRLRWILS